MRLIEEIRADFAKEWGEFELYLHESIKSSNPLLNTINDYLLNHSGKQLRPLLVLVTARACSGFINKTSVICATVTELIHTATLLHDDVVDDSNLRRGAPTVNNKFSRGASVLMGDYWLSKAINLLVTNKCESRILLAYSKTVEDLAAGEMLQMLRAEDLQTTQKDYYDIISRKTASLFVSSVTSAAFASNCSPDIIEGLESYALNLGISFQIRDDILDYAASDTTGKDSDSDIAERKITLPLLCALKNNASSRKEIISLLSGIYPSDISQSNNRIVDEIKHFVLDNSGVEDAKILLREYIDKSITGLDVLPSSRSKLQLSSIASAMQL